MLVLEQSVHIHSPKVFLQHAAPVSSHSSHEEQELDRDKSRKETVGCSLLTVECQLPQACGKLFIFRAHQNML